MYYVVCESKSSTYSEEGYESFYLRSSSGSNLRIGSHGGDLQRIYWEVKEEVGSLDEGVRVIEEEWLRGCDFRVEGEGEGRRWYEGEAPLCSQETTDRCVWGEGGSWIREFFLEGKSEEEATEIVFGELSENLSGKDVGYFCEDRVEDSITKYWERFREEKREEEEEEGW